MKKVKRIIAAMALLLAGVFSLPQCTKDNQVLNMNLATPNTDTLFATKVSTAPAISPIGGAAWDGTIDPAWNNASKLTVACTVPDPGNNTFTGFIGNSTTVTLRSVYNDQNIYFLMEWNCSQRNVQNAPWYFDPADKLWKQEDVAPSLNPDGVTFRPPFVQDQFLIMFNVANSCLKFVTEGCYAACHVHSSFGGADTIEGGSMYTNGPAEILDCWMSQMLQVVNLNQSLDTYIDWGDGLLNETQVHNDPQVNETDGGVNNEQTLLITGTSTEVSVPMWVNTSGTYNNGAILSTDTAQGSYVYISAVDSNGVLSYSATRGGPIIGAIDPNVGTDYQRISSGLGPKCMPGSIVASYTGSCGDVTANSYWTGNGWRLLLKRALTTSDAAFDVDFSSLADQPFGIGVMFNGADNEHAIANGLLLRFVK